MPTDYAKQEMRAAFRTYHLVVLAVGLVAAVADVIVTILNSPELLYRVEHGTDDARAESPLSAYELAAKLSYQFWQTPPDDALWEAAANGSLLTENGFATELERIVASPATPTTSAAHIGRNDNAGHEHGALSRAARVGSDLGTNLRNGLY